MKALITGASSGMGSDFARILRKRGYEVILVARRQDRLVSLAEEIGGAQIIIADLSDTDACYRLYEQVKEQNVDILINNAGFGVFGAFDSTSLESELSLIDVNIRAVHILTKLFLPDFIKKDSGYIMNVASIAGLMPGGPLFASYYASKAYVRSLTLSVAEELRRKKSKVKICALCPGSVKTEFDSVAGVSNALDGLSSINVAEYALDRMLKGQKIIVPGFKSKCSHFFAKVLPDNLLCKITYNIQKQKEQ